MLLALAVPAQADPRLVRVIWDVGNNRVYHRADGLVRTGHAQFVVPVSERAARQDGFVEVSGGTTFLRKGDRVRVYVVNYNSASHVVHDSSLAELVPLEPSLVGPFLNAALLSLTGAAAFPGANVMRDYFAKDGAPGEPACDPDVATTLDQARNDLRSRTVALLGASGRLVAEADTAKLSEIAGKVTGAAAADPMWSEFDNVKAFDALERHVDFPTASGPVKARIDELERAVREYNAALLAFDAPALGHPQCVTKEMIDERNALATSVGDVMGESAPVPAILASYRNAAKVWAELEWRLNPEWVHEAVELTIKGEVPADSVLRVDVVFVSTDKSVNRRIQRNLVLGVEPHLPALIISTGVGIHSLNLKELKVEQDVTTVGGAETVKSRLRIVNDTSWERIVPIWIQNVRVWRIGKGGLYATFGTTPNRNIFENGIIGGSFIRPDWRTTFTVGMIAAKGHEAKDLDPLVARFTDEQGFLLPDVSQDQLPMPSREWVRGVLVTVSFNLVSF